MEIATRVNVAAGRVKDVVTYKTGRRLVGALFIVAAMGFGSSTGTAADKTPPLPSMAPATHVGVASCAGSTCHGAITPWPGSSIRQDEYVVWTDKDPHATAYKILLSERSAKIAANLGLKNAYEAKVCLDCHADNVAPEHRGPGFQISDGVGCESCHGGAENWLGSHTSGKSDHAANVKAGLYPTDDASARAKLCLSCHFGDSDHFITHRIMGAGHPRLRFELDTFSVTQPAHFVVNASYRHRKNAPSHTVLWAVGQVTTVNALLDGMLDPNRNHDGMFPELVFFDCHACHHPMSDVRWQPHDDTGVGPGVPRIADANLIMLGAFLDQFDPALATEFHGKLKALHQASLKGADATLAAARALKTLTEGMAARITATTIDATQTGALLRHVIDRGVNGEYLDYAAAEQATMALSAFLDNMKADNALSAGQYKKLTGVLNQCYAAVEKDEAFDPKRFQTALQALNAAISRT